MDTQRVRTTNVMRVSHTDTLMREYVFVTKVPETAEPLNP